MDETLMPDDFSGVGTYQYNPRLKPKPYAELAAAAQGKLKKPAVPAAAPNPAAAPAVANPAAKGAAASNGGAAANQSAATDQKGMMGFGDIMNSPEAWQAGLELGQARSDASSINLMNSGKGAVVPYGGKLSWAEALNNGIRQGMGMYGYLDSQKAKANALRKFEDLFAKRADQQKEAELFAPGRGSGQHSVQGNPDYETDL